MGFSGPKKVCLTVVVVNEKLFPDLWAVKENLKVLEFQGMSGNQKFPLAVWRWID